MARSKFIWACLLLCFIAVYTLYPHWDSGYIPSFERCGGPLRPAVRDDAEQPFDHMKYVIDRAGTSFRGMLTSATHSSRSDAELLRFSELEERHEIHDNILRRWNEYVHSLHIGACALIRLLSSERYHVHRGSFLWNGSHMLMESQGNMIYLATLTGHVPIIPPWMPNRLLDANVQKPLPFGEVSRRSPSH
jgi:hypothetical protein